MSRTAHITIDLSVSLDEEDLWPDGDAPEAWSPEDVVALMERDAGGSLTKLINEWGLATGAEVTVDVDGARADWNHNAS